MTASRIAKQLEFYFSDANLATDKFLTQELQNSVEGWIPISVPLSFNRMKQLQADATSCLTALATSDFLEVDMDGQRIRRKMPYIPGLSGSNVQNTLHIKGFPTHLTLEDLETFFHEKSIQPLVIRLRKDMKSKEFMGKVFVEFDTKEKAESVMQEGLMYEDLPLEIETKQTWLSRHDKKSSSSAKQQAVEVREPLKLDQLVKLEGITPGLSFSQIKEMFENDHCIAYASVEANQNCAFIRLRHVSAAEFMKKYASHVQEPLSLVPASEEELAAFVAKMDDSKKGQPFKAGRNKRFKKKY